ncbi:MAG: 3-oxoacyl-ACP synthase, partial [Chloroflexi bacterium]|nr:3-oxoacyl-ACP synthase [Chloroflexota bacterium]
HVSDMAVAAGRAALQDAGVSPDEVDLVIYCGSEYKDYIVWSAAVSIAHRLGCRRAQAFEVYALCAGTPIALRTARALMQAEPDLRTVLVVAASKESELVDRTNGRTRFMFTFGDGAGAALLRREGLRNRVLESASLVDGTLSQTVVMPAGGSRANGSDAQRYLDVPDLPGMRARLDEVSGPNFLRVAREALRRSGRGHVDFLAPVHLKRSMHDWLRRELGASRGVYLDGYGHMQAADQIVALAEGRRRGLLRDGDVVLLAAAGVGYTWAATVVVWGSER